MPYTSLIKIWSLGLSLASFAACTDREVEEIDDLPAERGGPLPAEPEGVDD